MTVSENADPIYDEEGDSGGLPAYEPLKLGEERTREGGGAERGVFCRY